VGRARGHQQQHGRIGRHSGSRDGGRVGSRSACMVELRARLQAPSAFSARRSGRAERILGVQGRTGSTSAESAGVLGEALAAGGRTFGVYGATVSQSSNAAGVNMETAWRLGWDKEWEKRNPPSPAPAPE
jgi:hypothetical protein